MQKVITIEGTYQGAKDGVTRGSYHNESEHPKLNGLLEDGYTIKHIVKTTSTSASYYAITYILEKGEVIDDFGPEITSN